MRPILVASLPCTGSHFVLDLFTQHRRVHHSISASPGTKCMVHFNEPGGACIKERSRESLTVVPMRSRTSIIASWKRRGMRDQWTAFAPPDGAFIFNIEAPDREERLDELSGLVGYRLRTDWKPVNRMP